MKRITLFVVAFLLIGSISAWADQATINFDFPQGTVSDNCVQSSAGATFCGQQGSPTFLDEMVFDTKGDTGTISYEGGISNFPFPIAPGPIITAIITSGDGYPSCLTYSDCQNPADPHTYSVGFAVTNISPALLADLGLGSAPSSWTGTASGTYFEVSGMVFGGSSAELTDPPPSPAPEPGTFILLGLGVAVMIIGWRAGLGSRHFARLTP